MAAINQSQQKPTFMQSFNSLHWYDIFTSFIFRFMAKTSEPLLAAGVILSAVDFLQRGQLLTNNSQLSLWWSIAQGVAMEVSVGPVLVNALDAYEDHDPLKTKCYSALSAILALVGGAMLLMQFGLSVGGLTEGQISQWVLWPLFVARTVASISYIALSCTKHKRFSGISPKAVISEANRAFEDAIVRVTAIQVSTQAALEQMHAHLTQVETRTLHEIGSIRSSITTEVRGQIDSRFNQMEQITEEQLRLLSEGFAEQVSVVRVTLEEHTKVIRRIPERTITEVSSPLVKLPAKGGSLSPSQNPLANSENDDFDKRAFVRACLVENPEVSISDIQRRATEQKQTIAPSYISTVRKAFRSEEQSLSPSS